MMRALVFGKTGQVARELARHIPKGCLAIFLDRASADLSCPGQCAAAIMAHRPDMVINAAAFTAVDDAEAQEELATQINGAAPGEMARICATLDIPFLHLSTDYVFDGTGDMPALPSHPTAPINAYGRSKAQGEAEICAASGTAFILRVSWIFSEHGRNFVTTMRRLAETHDHLRIVADQIGGPTPASEIAKTLWIASAALRDGNGAPGIYHYCGSPAVSWADFARDIFAQTGKQMAITDIPSTEYPTPARRPLNSRLDCTSFHNEFGIPQPDWHEHLRRILQQAPLNG